MKYKVVPLKSSPNLAQDDIYGVRTGNNRDDAVSKLETAIEKHLAKTPPTDAVIYVYPASSGKLYEAISTTDLKYVPKSPDSSYRGKMVINPFEKKK